MVQYTRSFRKELRTLQDYINRVNNSDDNYQIVITLCIGMFEYISDMDPVLLNRMGTKFGKHVENKFYELCNLVEFYEDDSANEHLYDLENRLMCYFDSLV
jgi:hypothetical protein